MELNFSELNWFDIAVISTVIISTLFAFFRGFIRVTMSLLTWGCASAATVMLYPHVYEILKTKVSGEKAAIALSSLGTFGVVFVIIALISLKIISMLRSIEGGIIDRTLGFGLGFARGIIIVCLVFFSINMTSKTLRLGEEDKPGPKWFTQAKTYNTLKVSSVKGLEYLPKSFTDELVGYVDKVKNSSVAMVENKMDNGVGNASKTLNEDETKTMKQVIVLLPKEDLSKVYAKYGDSTSFRSDLEKMAVFREILKLYKDAVAAGSVDKGRLIADSDMAKLEAALNLDGIPGAKPEEVVPAPSGEPEVPAEGAEPAGATGADSGEGYKQNNIKQMDRLVGNVGGQNDPEADNVVPVEQPASTTAQ